MHYFTVYNANISLSKIQWYAKDMSLCKIEEKVRQNINRFLMEHQNRIFHDQLINPLKGRDVNWLHLAIQV